MKKDTRKLIKMALITSPLLAIYNVAPISLMLNSGMIKVELPLLPNPNSSLRFLFPVTFITLNALIVWLFNIWLVSKARNKRLGVGARYLISFLFTFFLVITFSSIGSQVRPFPQEISVFRLYPFVGMAANNTFILIIIDLILNREKKAALEIEKATLEAANLKSRHEQLKQQIQPHFLFNALNTLKILVKNKRSSAEHFVVNLSNLLRSTLADQGTEKVSIKRDLEILDDFLHLQQVRFPGSITYQHSIPQKILESRQLPVFTLQILAENATKHNVLSQKKPLKITIDYENEFIHFKNNLNPMIKQPDSTGIGLTNLSERFQMLTGKDLKVDKRMDDFTVSIPII